MAGVHPGDRRWPHGSTTPSSPPSPGSTPPATTSSSSPSPTSEPCQSLDSRHPGEPTCLKLSAGPAATAGRQPARPPGWPLTPDRLGSIGWADNQGLTDAGNQFHYYRRTPDDRILFGGYDAVYYRGNRTEPSPEQHDRSHHLLARHLLETFPQLRGVAFTHRWSGLIDTTSRFTPMFGTALGGRVGYAVGYTGLGVGSSRFGARVALDLLDARDTERTRLRMVRRRPVPFPPEPLRYPAVQLTRAALARQDEDGHRGVLLRALDRLGVGFTS